MQGSALITAPHNLPLRGADIYLQCTCVHVTTKIINSNSQAGISQTKFMAINHARSKARHTFLSVHQPTNELKSTIPNIFEERSRIRISVHFHDSRAIAVTILQSSCTEWIRQTFAIPCFHRHWEIPAVKILMTLLLIWPEYHIVSK